jgi:hypothetical protein
MLFLVTRISEAGFLRRQGPGYLLFASSSIAGRCKACVFKAELSLAEGERVTSLCVAKEK